MSCSVCVVMVTTLVFLSTETKVEKVTQRSPLASESIRGKRETLQLVMALLCHFHIMEQIHVSVCVCEPVFKCDSVILYGSLTLICQEHKYLHAGVTGRTDELSGSNDCFDSAQVSVKSIQLDEANS